MASNGLGIATTRLDDRSLAVTGLKEYTDTVFEGNESVLHAGVLFAIPALKAQGLDIFFKVLKPLSAGYYGLHHILLTMCFMALCRIKNPEQLKKYPPGELGKILGLDRIPEVGHFRKKIKQITNQSKSDELHVELFRSWKSDMPEMIFYIDGHLRVYNGHKANLPKRFVSREKLCLSGTTEYWVNDQRGNPLMVITAELNEKIKTGIEAIIPNILSSIPPVNHPNEPAFTLVMDREAYEPAWFKKLWDEHRIAIITYRKNVKDKWDKSLFKTTEVEMHNQTELMQLCEMGTMLNGLWFREVRKLTDNGHQTAIITTHPNLQLQQVAIGMFSRWTQENFFKYMIANFDFDKLIEYGTDSVNQKLTLPNPERKRIQQELKKVKEKKTRLDARIAQEMGSFEILDVTCIKKAMIKHAKLMPQIEAYKLQIIELKNQIDQLPTRISIAQMPEEKRYNKLKQESKKLKNAVIMLIYRAETALYTVMTEFYKNNEKDGRMLLKEIFTNDADIIPDYEKKQLIVRLHSLSSPRANKAVHDLCAFLNETETIYPFTDIVLK